MSAAPNPIRITLVPHTHWDREWYQPFDEFLKRLVDMMDALLAAAEDGFPHFHLDGQTAMIDDYLAVRPEREADLRRLAAQGRLSLGPWVTQMDEFLASGESHIRNLERGLARARELGPALEVGYLPDQFGHIGQMPQILRMLGVESAVVWRGVPAAIDRDAFWWEAPDGSRVLADYLAFGYFNGARYSEASHGEQLAGEIRRTVDRQRELMATDRVLVMVGSDHSGPDRPFVERVSDAGRSLGVIEARIDSLANHLQGRALGEGVPLWRGELRSSARAHLLPNVYSARPHQKRERGRVESLLERYAEPLAALVPHAPEAAEELDRAWLLLLWNGAHDSACGCSHDRVARDVDARFDEARRIADGVVRDCLRALADRIADHGTLWFNPSPLERDGVPGLGWLVGPSAGEAPGTAEVPVQLHATDGRIVADGMAFELVDEPDVGDLYTFCPAGRGEGPVPPARLEIDEGRQMAVASWGALEVRIRISRRAGEPFLRLAGEIHNALPDHRLRLHVSLPRDAGETLAGSPFELVHRAATSEGSDLEPPSPTWPARGVVAAAGVAVLHEGVFEYELTAGNELAVTLLRCVGTISRHALTTRPFPAGPDVATPDAQMIGTTEFSLGAWDGATAHALFQQWERFALPLVSAAAPGGGSLPRSGHLLSIEGEGQLSSIRPHRGAVQVRLWNARSDVSIVAAIDGTPATLRPAEIATVSLEPLSLRPG
jgi:alpha-mannosidase